MKKEHWLLVISAIFFLGTAGIILFRDDIPIGSKKKVPKFASAGQIGMNAVIQSDVTSQERDEVPLTLDIKEEKLENKVDQVASPENASPKMKIGNRSGQLSSSSSRDGAPQAAIDAAVDLLNDSKPNTIPEVEESITTPKTVDEQTARVDNDAPWPREATVKVVWYATRDGKPSGGATNMGIRIAKSGKLGSGVAVVDNFPGSSGAMWESSMWMASFVACQQLGLKIADYEFSVKIFDSTAGIDGPSAGMIITATIAALLKGDEVLTDIALTGTINPDGTIGPVGGIPLKMRGAKAKGVTRFGFPIGLRRSRDELKKKHVDLVSFGESIELEAVPIRDLEEAYRFVTGKEMGMRSASQKDDASQFMISVALSERLSSAKSDVTIRGLELINTSLGSATRALPKGHAARALGILTEDFKKYRAKANVLEARGSLVSAYVSGIQSFAVSHAIRQFVEIEISNKENGSEGVIEFLQSDLIRAHSRIDNLSRSIRAGLDRYNLDHQVNTINAYILAKEAEAHWLVALDNYGYLKNLYKKRVTNPESKKFTDTELSVFKLWVSACSKNIIAANVRAEIAKDWNSFDSGTLGVEIQPPHQFFKDFASSYSRGAQAALSYFETTYVLGKDDKGRMQFQISEPLFQPAKQAVRLTKTAEIAAEFGSAENLDGELKELVDRKKVSTDRLDAYASGIYAYLTFSRLILKYYNFGYEGRVDGQDDWLQGFRSANELMDSARSTAYFKANRLKEKSKSVPDSIIMNLELGDSLRSGNDEEKLNAFYSFWKASFLCDTAMGLLANKNEPNNREHDNKEEQNKK